MGLSPVDRLIQALEGQRAIYAALLSLYSDNAEAMNAWHLADLRPMLLEEQRLIRELHHYEQRRLAAGAQLAREHGLPDDTPPRQSQLLSVVEEPERQRLSMLGEELAQSMAQLEEAREPLLPVLQSALAFLARHDKGQANAVTNPYGASGRPSSAAQKPKASFLDKKV